MRDNIDNDSCRVCGRILEDGVICEDCKNKYKPKENDKSN